jgi:hypothetical protein
LNWGILKLKALAKNIFFGRFPVKPEKAKLNLEIFLIS